MSDDLAAVDGDAVAARLVAVRDRLAAVARPSDAAVRIVAVTKGFDGSAIEAAVGCGLAAVGENYAQQVVAKRATIERLRPDVHFIGHLQSNKVRQLTELVTVWGTLDRASIVDEVAKRAPGGRVRLQVNTTDEDQKAGVAPAALADLLARARDRGLAVEGLMTIGPTGGTPAATRRAFGQLRALVDRHDLAECSMGMTHDAEIALEEGSTEVRIGTALFGARPG